MCCLIYEWNIILNECIYHGMFWFWTQQRSREARRVEHVVKPILTRSSIVWWKWQSDYLIDTVPSWLTSDQLFLRSRSTRFCFTASLLCSKPKHSVINSFVQNYIPSINRTTQLFSVRSAFLFTWTARYKRNYLTQLAVLAFSQWFLGSKDHQTTTKNELKIIHFKNITFLQHAA